MLGQWGDFTYDSTKNIVAFQVPVLKNTDVYEGFTIQLEDKIAGFDLNLLWDSTKIQIPAQLVNTKPVITKKKKKKRN